MTDVYFVRHAEANQNVHNDSTRPLTEKGLQDRMLVTKLLSSKPVSAFISSPYKRAYDTISPIAVYKICNHGLCACNLINKTACAFNRLMCFYHLRTTHIQATAFSFKTFHVHGSTVER